MYDGLFRARFHFQGKAYEHKVLPFGMSLAPRTFTKCMDAALAPLRRQGVGGVRMASYLDDWLTCAPSERQARSNTEVVLALNREKSCLITSRTVTYLGLVLDSNVMRASLTPKRLSVLREHLSCFSVTKQVTVKFGQRLLGLLVAATQAVPLGLLDMHPLQQWFARHRVSPLEDGRRLLPSPGSCGMVAYDAVPSGGCSHGSGMFQSHNIYRRLHEGLGRSVPELFSLGSVETLLERGSCEPTRVRGCASGVGVLGVLPGEAGRHQDRQFCGGFLYQPPGGYALSGTSQQSLQASFVGAGSWSLLESGVPAREGQCGSQSSVQGRSPSRGMAAPPRHHAGHLGPFQPGSGGPLCLPGDYSLPLVVFHDRPQGHIGGGCPGSSVRFSPLPSSASGAGPSEDVAGQGASGGPGLASSALDGRASDNAGGDPLASPGQAGHALTGAGPAVASKPRVLQAACLTPGRGASSDLVAAVIRTLQAARAPSTRGLYTGCWNRFCGWCRSRGENPVSCGASVVLAFLQSLLESGLSVSTLRGYVAAISSRHKLVDGLTMGTQALVDCFLRGAQRLCPPRGRLIPAWDLRVVLDALTEPPFEPLSGLGWELLSLKTVFLLATASAKRELHALSVHPAFLQPGGDGSAISLLLNPAFLPKVLPHSFVARPLVLDPFRPPPHESPEAARLHLVCSVRALRSYIARTSSIIQTDQLFVCFGESV